MVTTIPFNHYTTSMMLQGEQKVELQYEKVYCHLTCTIGVMEKPLEKKAGRNFGPPGSKKLIYFIDDMNMPAVDTYGTVQPHTLIQQHLDYQHWYDRQKMTLKEIRNVQYIACMNPTAGSFTINPRLQRHFTVFAVNFPSADGLRTIYQSILSQHVGHAGFPQPVQKMVDKIITAAVSLHQKARSFWVAVCCVILVVLLLPLQWYM